MILTKKQFRKIILREYKKMLGEVTKKKKVHLKKSDEKYLEDAEGLRLVRATNDVEDQLDYVLTDVDIESDEIVLADPAGRSEKIDFDQLLHDFEFEIPAKKRSREERIKHATRKKP
jgi:hypothetical protein